MMRGLIALLLLLNLTTLAWQWEVFAPWGWAPASAREPERLLNQIRPDAIRIETPVATEKRLAAERTQLENAQAEISPSNTASSATTSATTSATISAATNTPSAKVSTPAVAP